MKTLIPVSFILLVSLPWTSARLRWKNTRFFFAFGDSYTTDGYNISAGVNSPVPDFTSANGLNWAQFLGNAYNITNTQIFDLASGGATIDAALVPPFQPTVLSIVDQVQQFKSVLSQKPVNAIWDGSNSFFAFWIGINDVGNSAGWTNITRPEFYTTLMDRLTTQLDELYGLGARSFLFLTVPPTDRSPLVLQQGQQASTLMHTFIAQYNNELLLTLNKFQRRHQSTIQDMVLFDTQPVFNMLLDNADALGYVNITGWCTAYENGIGGFGLNTQVDGCAPVTSYFWLNSLHPLFTVHDILARAISTRLSA
ncbi:carbohydrate esterase family 16 protein [Macrolepiota fuliginosa MF-IS2]|uniref:Carbohydrate esterase family 16 protein n=1 Tax=Macrolepiota fuliginosa MF-IS2 TaxID=1400762 RepID=A0A9P6C3T0_9AGAR|nr:carbohydrate esterase family 16 protein [Macrolepiota fuliginosa MF-IS2]